MTLKKWSFAVALWAMLALFISPFVEHGMKSVFFGLITGYFSIFMAYKYA